MTPEESQDADLWRRSFSVRMDAFENKLEENTEATERIDASTRELVGILTSWKGAFAVLEFLGKVAKPVAAIIAMGAAAYAWWTQK